MELALAQVPGSESASGCYETASSGRSDIAAEALDPLHFLVVSARLLGRGHGRLHLASLAHRSRLA